MRLVEVVARSGTLPPAVEDPAISLKRLVVPRAAPRLEVLEAVLAAAFEAVAAGRVAAGVPVYRRPRPLRLPRIWGAMSMADRSACTVPVTRTERRSSPVTTVAVRVTMAAVRACSRSATRARHCHRAPAINRTAAAVHHPPRLGLRGLGRTIAG